MSRTATLYPSADGETVRTGSSAAVDLTSTTETFEYQSKGGGELSSLLFKFDLTEIPANATIESVTFSLYVTAQSGWAGAEGEFSLARSTEDFTDGNWDSNSVTGAYVTDAAPTTISAYNVIETDQSLLTWVQGWHDGSITNHGFAFYVSAADGVDDGDIIGFGMVDHGTQGVRPKLEVTYKVGGYQQLI